MGRRPSVKPRRPIFIGVEGKSEQAFVKFLQHLCDENNRNLSLDCSVGSGGDTVKVVLEADCSLKKRSGRNQYKERLVLLDRDRVEEDREAGRDAEPKASELGFLIIFQDPNLEGLLIRLHQGLEQKTVQKGTESARLRKLWPEYRKPPTADQLIRRFGLDHLRRAAGHDEGLGRLLDVLGLKFPAGVELRESLRLPASRTKPGNLANSSRSRRLTP